MLAHITWVIDQQKVTYKALLVYFYGVKFFHKVCDYDLTPFDDQLVSLALRAARARCKPPKKDIRLPLTLPLIAKIITYLGEPSSSWLEPMRITTRALLCFGWSSGLRPSSYVTRKIDGILVADELTWNKLAFRADRITVHIPRSKTDPFREGRYTDIRDTKTIVDTRTT